MFLASENIDFTGLSHVFLLGGGEGCLFYKSQSGLKIKCNFAFDIWLLTLTLTLTSAFTFVYVYVYAYAYAYAYVYVYVYVYVYACVCPVPLPMPGHVRLCRQYLLRIDTL